MAAVCASPPPADVHSVKQKTEHNDVTWQNAAVLLHEALLVPYSDNCLSSACNWL